MPEKMQLDYPMGIDLREKGPEWEQLFEKSRLENYKNRNGVMSFDDSPYNLGREGATSSSNSLPSTSSTATGGKFGFVMNNLSKIAFGFVAGAVVGKALSSSSSSGEKVRVKEVKVEVPGKERIKVVKEIVKIPGPTRVVTRYQKVPGPEKIVEKIVEKKVKVPGPEKIVYKDRIVKEKVEVPGKEIIKVVYKDKPVEKLVYKEKIVKEKVEVPGKEKIVTKEVKVPGKEKIVYKDKPVEKIVYKDKIVEKKVEVPGKEKIVYKDKPVEKIVEKVVFKEKKSLSGGGSRGDPRLPNGSPKVTIRIGNTVGFFYDIEK